MKKLTTGWATLAVLLCAPVRGATDPTGPAEPAAVIEPCVYADDAAAQRAWVPMRGSTPVSWSPMNGQAALRFPCDFQNTTVERASWDRQVKMDLSSGVGIRLSVLCRDASPVSYFSIYFQSGSGWYHGTFFPESATEWNTIVLGKADMTSEGQPAGWGQISAIRISAWRGQARNTEFFLRDLRQVGVLGAEAMVAILRCESATRQSPDEKRNVEQFTETIARHLAALGVGCSVINDLDIRGGGLDRAKVVVLPYNPSLPERASAELLRYLAHGGKLAAFYTVPEKLRVMLHVGEGRHIKADHPGAFSSIRFASNALAGAPPVVAQSSWNITAFQPVPGASRVLAEWFDEQGRPTGQPAVIASSNSIVMTHVLLPDDPANKGRMLLAMLGSLAPDVWRQATEAALASMGSIGGFKSYDEAATGILLMGQGATNVTEALDAARVLRESAARSLADAKFAAALDQAAAAGQRLKEAFCLAQQPLPGEFRAFWCHSAFGVQGIDWDEAARRLAENGFTAVLPNMLWGGAAFYPSKILPVAWGVSERGDQVEQCLAACRKHGLQLHVWKVNWNLGQAAPKEFVEKLRREKRLQANSKGREELWLCPSRPANQQLEIDSLVEVARRYAVAGIHFDYVRYPDADHCYCEGCRERFQRAVGERSREWPKEVLPDGRLRRQWLNWRRGNITAVVKAVSEQARAVRPGIKISAAVFPNWNSDRDTIGQDWRLWCEKGYLDFVCPMDYTSSNRSFENMVQRQVEWAGKVPLYPGIGASASSSHLPVDRVIQQISITRRHNTGGFVIFNYGAAESKELLPLLGLGITARR